MMFQRSGFVGSIEGVNTEQMGRVRNDLVESLQRLHAGGLHTLYVRGHVIQDSWLGWLSSPPPSPLLSFWSTVCLPSSRYVLPRKGCERRCFVRQCRCIGDVPGGVRILAKQRAIYKTFLRWSHLQQGISCKCCRYFVERGGAGLAVASTDVICLICWGRI